MHSWFESSFVEIKGRSSCINNIHHGPLTRYVKFWVAHAPGMPGTFSTPPTSKETASLRSRHASRHVRDARAVMHVGIANTRWRGRCSRHSRRMRNLQFYVSGKGLMAVDDLSSEQGAIQQQLANRLSAPIYSGLLSLRQGKF